MTKIIDFEKIIVQTKVYGGGIAKEELSRLFSKKPTRFGGSGGYEKHKELCIKFGIILEKKERLEITELGKEFLETIAVERGEYRIGRKSDEQKKFLKRKLKDRWPILVEYFSNAESDLVYNDEEGQILFRKDELKKIDEAFIEILEEIGVVIVKHDSYVISDEIESKFSISGKEPKITEEQFDKINAKRRECGKRAEDETVQFERLRVFKLGKILKVDKIKRVSDNEEKGISMGYDIESFDGDNYTEEYDRFIEVKGSCGNKPEIFWSENEIEKAKKLGEHYWLYVWINVGKLDERLVGTISDPYKKIMENDKIIKLPKTTYMINLKNYFDGENESKEI